MIQMKKAAFYTLGCKVNQYETEAMSELFEKEGYVITDFNKYADVYVINTCTVTSMSDRKSRQIIRRAKKNNPNAVVAVTGCYAQTNPKEVLEIPDVNLVVGNNDRKNIVKMCNEVNPNQKENRVYDIMKIHEFEEMEISSYSERTRAFIKIQEGCNQYCSYCIIPYARGPIRSREQSLVLEETERLVKNGYTEIIYTGIHIASYGLDRGKQELLELLLKADKIDGLKRIRLSSIEPMTLNEDFVKRISQCSKLCHHFHLSLQSGCDETLKRMNRKYTTHEYKKIVQGLRKQYPDCAITTDIMTGFVGETDAEFEKTVQFVKDIEFSDAHIFQYSQRKGTNAYKKPNQIPPEVKEERSKILIDICKLSQEKFIKSFIGQSLEVLFEQRDKNGYFEGKTSNYITVKVKTDESLSGEYRNVIIDKAEDGVAYGHF